MVSGVLGSPVLAAGLQPLVWVHPVIPGLRRREQCEGPPGRCLVSLPSPCLLRVGIWEWETRAQLFLLSVSPC